MELFKKEELIKESMISLSNDDAKWTKEIMVDFLSTFPILQQTPVNLIWRKKEGAKGYGIGSITVLNGAVPVVVKNFKAYPFDIIVLPTKVIPFDDITINELMSSNSPFIGASSAKNKVSLNMFGDKDLRWSPAMNYGTNSQPPAEKIASFIERISEFDYKDIKKVANELKEDNFLQEALKNSENVKESFNKIAAKAVNYETRFVELLKHAEVDRQLLFRDKDNNSYIKQAFSGIDDTVTTKISWEDEQVLTNMFAKIKTNEIKKVAEFIPSSSLSIGSEGAFKDSSGNMTNKMHIVAIEKIASLKEYSIIPMENNKSLLIDIGGNYAVLELAFKKPVNFENVLSRRENKPAIGQKGIFVVDNIATEPFEITKIIPDFSSPGKFEIYASTFNNPKFIYSLIPTNHNSITQDKNDYEKFWVPGNAVFVKLGYKLSEYSLKKIKPFINEYTGMDGYRIKAIENLESKDYVLKSAECIDLEKGVIPMDAIFGNSLEKVANLKIDNLISEHVIRKDNIGLYSLDGPEFSKYAELGHKIKELKEEEVKWPLVHVGVDSETFDNVLNMGNSTELKIANVLKAPISVFSFIKQAEEKTAIKNVKVPYLENFIKYAARYSKESTTVDAVLTLGMVNKFNINEYLDLIPDYERVLSELSRLLMFIRVSDDSVDEDILASLVSDFNKVLFQLKTFRATVNSKKSSYQGSL